MRDIFTFSGPCGRGTYQLFTLAFAATLFGLAATQGDAPVTQMLSAPWSVLGHALDSMIQIRDRVLDFIVSLGVGFVLLWGFVAMTVGRLRDIGQSPWWTVLVILSGVVVPAMIVLSLIPPANRVKRGGVGPMNASLARAN